MRCLPGLLLTSALLATNVAAQTQIASWNLPADGTSALGQAQAGAVMATSNGGGHRLASRFLSNGAAAGGAVTGALTNTFWAVENTDLRPVATDPFNGSISMFSGSSLLTQYTYPMLNPVTFRCGPSAMVPIDDGKVLVVVGCSGQPGASFHVFDPNLALVDSIPIRPDAAVRGVTRRPDGSLVVCTRNGGDFSTTRLMAMTTTGSVLWDVFIGGQGGGVASDSHGAVYVAQSSGSVFVYTPDGVFDHAWTGPPGSPFAQLKDIASSRDGTVLYTLEGQTGMRSFGNLPTATRSMSWGRVKQHYR